ncbi:arsenate reductase family protein [Clostridium botulinum]|uniref:ArsC family protein n=1 Tax=Clostridium botulinum (strain Eklund 17B / Type B) TaxID=935198 RepID=B2TPJ2_CLOBB|nr:MULTISPECIES: arsenate reductase family protein [unclassified Clostridium]ACD22568.1 ArsC family protein [Clostridium botulinum B str. Eklund 17B (NRP)]MBN1046395.1 arsenate reductase family protein [Clostridium botulinum]MBN1056294.1 arsenate reductase family protein [Clostridium botulinum]MBY6975333.1 arsenate reductase family protein [Clostridium botulinum]MBY7000882.1 arsenate reductase family protein [Clostridium botulinum]
MLLVQYPKCSTCKKALKFLKENNFEIEVRDIVNETPTREELLEWIDKSNLEFKKFFNTSGKVYKELNLKDKINSMTKEEAIELLSSNGMLIKRPILINENLVIVGFKEYNYSKLQ